MAVAIDPLTVHHELRPFLFVDAAGVDPEPNLGLPARVGDEYSVSGSAFSHADAVVLTLRASGSNVVRAMGTLTIEPAS